MNGICNPQLNLPGINLLSLAENTGVTRRQQAIADRDTEARGIGVFSRGPIMVSYGTDENGRVQMGDGVTFSF